MHEHALHAPGPCRNCGALPVDSAGQANYCAQCGQETALHPPTFAEFVHEFIGHYVALEGALWRTLGLLLFKPGRLTREYLDGRRKRYVLPLRLYLTISFIFFVALKVGSSSEVSPTAAGAPAAKEWRAPECGKPGTPACSAAQDWLKGRVDAARKNVRGSAVNLDARVAVIAPYVMFFLLPVFAAIMLWVWRSRGMTYGEHFVFSLHLHSFWFVALLVSGLLPGAVGEWLVLLLPVYAIAAMRGVYRATWGAALARGIAGLAVYAVALAAALAGTLVFIIATLGG